MKKLKNKIILPISVLTLLFVFAIKANAQQVEVGLRYMPTFSSLDLYTSTGGHVHGSVTLDNGGGVFAGYCLTDHIELQGEIIYNSLSQKYSELNADRTINIQYVNIPLLASFNSGKTQFFNVNVVIGPQIGINVGSSVKTTSGNIINVPSAMLNVKPGDLGFVYGAGVDFGLNASRTFRLGLGFRGVYGLLDISDNSKTVANNSYLILDRTHISTYSGYIGLSYLFL
jgi:hypothetical protein